ncbi:MAG: sigma-70 family RNA polymerase sigma factor [Woeseiaceae bacterium]
MPESRSAADELGDRLFAALAELSELERVCFVLKHLEQWRLKEIAEHLGTSDGTVKQAVFRAVRKLRPRMAVLQGEMT